MKPAAENLGVWGGCLPIILGGVAWRIIPRLGYLVNNHDARTSPLTGVVPLPNGLSMACKWGNFLTTYIQVVGAHPPRGAMEDMSGLKVGFDGT